MKTIGVRELRQRASEFLRQVERGHTVEVTEHGRPVARLVPVRGGTVRERLSRSGRLTLAAGDLVGLGAPLPAASGTPAPSEALRRARDRER